MKSTLTPPAGIISRVDPVTFEVIRHRLRGITTEQATRISEISGSKHVTEMSDFNVGLYLGDGSVAAMGRTILLHSACMAAMVRHVIADCAENPGIGPGDMFIVNDPWKGSVHAPDMAIVMPLFIDGRLVMWSGAMMHMPDIGGMQEGSMAMASTDALQEGLLLPPIKLMDAGMLRQDVWRMILANTRAASNMSLDLKGLMAANYAAKTGLEKLAGRYGVDAVLAVMEGLIATSAHRLRLRLSELPDVTVEVAGFFEYTPSVREIPEVRLILSKAGDRLRFDYSKSSMQVPESTNCTWSGLMAGISAAMLPTLAYDIAWNEGLYQPLEVICPEGLVCNARRPAAVSGNINGAVWEVEMVATSAISRILACTDLYMNEAQAGPCGRPAALGFFGVNQHGERYMGRTYDVLCSGTGAYFDHDGVSANGHHNIERTVISNIESLESDFPLLYLTRRLATDSGGAGRQHGGASLESAYVAHKAEPTVLRSAAAWDVPDSPGIFGGFPGAQNAFSVVRGSDVREQFAAGRVPSFHELRGERDAAGDLVSRTLLGTTDVIHAQQPAGGGWGDPIDRSLEDVTNDLHRRVVSRNVAEKLYGVVLDASGTVDAAASERRRAGIRSGRTMWPAQMTIDRTPMKSLARIHPLGDALEIAQDDRGRRWTRCRCGHVLAESRENWREYAGRMVGDPAETGLALRLHDRLELRQYSCRGCGKLLAVDVERVGAPDVHDIRFQLAE